MSEEGACLGQLGHRMRRGRFRLAGGACCPPLLRGVDGGCAFGLCQSQLMSDMLSIRMSVIELTGDGDERMQDHVERCRCLNR